MLRDVLFIRTMVRKEWKASKRNGPKLGPGYSFSLGPPPQIKWSIWCHIPLGFSKKPAILTNQVVAGQVVAGQTGFFSVSEVLVNSSDELSELLSPHQPPGKLPEQPTKATAAKNKRKRIIRLRI